MAMDKKKIEQSKKELSDTIKYEQRELKSLSDSKRSAMDAYTDVLGLQDIDPELSQEIMNRQSEDIRNIERIGSEHAEVISESKEKGEKVAEEAADTSNAATKAADRLNKLGKTLEKVGITAISDAADNSQKNADMWEKEKQEILDKNRDLEDLKREYQSLWIEDFNTSKQLYTLRKKALKRDESYDQNIGHDIISDIAVEFDEESLKNYESDMENSGEYNYDGSVDREANGIEELDEINPTEIHHFLTNKRMSEGKYEGISEEFNSIVQRYGLDLDGEWNKGEVPFHRGTHAVEYHDFMLKELKNIDRFAQGDKNRFLELFSSLKNEVSRNPELLYVRGWIGNYSKERYGIIE